MFEHVIPIAMGGTNFIDHIQSLCLSWNTRKKGKDYRVSRER
ncbi:MAG: HNH endonuclease [Chloroflexi bacterium]|nr:MAG: HNH endonuclease [Chloroflexota bacterium]